MFYIDSALRICYDNDKLIFNNNIQGQLSVIKSDVEEGGSFGG